MTLYSHELKRGRLSLLIWTAAIAFMMAVSIVIYPEMTSQMEAVNEAFADMGSFSAAFGMDQLNFGEFLGYFAVECGETLGLGGGMFAALLGIGMLAKEERDHTAEFLLTQPVSRTSVVTAKLLAILTELVILNVAVFALSAACILLIGEEIEGTLVLLFLACFLLQVELAAVCFGISAFLRRGGLGVGLGLTLGLYFLNIVANITEKVEFLKYFTPFAYTDGAEIVGKGSLNTAYLLIGLALTVLGIAASYLRYRNKDIA